MHVQLLHAVLDLPALDPTLQAVVTLTGEVHHRARCHLAALPLDDASSHAKAPIEYDERFAASRRPMHHDQRVGLRPTAHEPFDGRRLLAECIGTDQPLRPAVGQQRREITTRGDVIVGVAFRRRDHHTDAVLGTGLLGCTLPDLAPVVVRDDDDPRPVQRHEEAGDRHQI